MQAERETWPNACTVTGFTVDNTTGAYIYYDLKPMQYGRISIGLYTDTACIVEYEGNTPTIDQVIISVVDYDEDEGGDDYYAAYATAAPTDFKASLYELEKTMDKWNHAFDVYKQCQPCKAYDLSNYVAGKGNKWARKLDEDEEDEDEDFDCHDDAGYVDVNQVSIACKGNERIRINKI
jgi:hypothetical protein